MQELTIMLHALHYYNNYVCVNHLDHMSENWCQKLKHIETLYPSKVNIVGHKKHRNWHIYSMQSFICNALIYTTFSRANKKP